MTHLKICVTHLKTVWHNFKSMWHLSKSVWHNVKTFLILKLCCKFKNLCYMTEKLDLMLSLININIFQVHFSMPKLFSGVCPPKAQKYCFRVIQKQNCATLSWFKDSLFLKPWNFCSTWKNSTIFTYILEFVLGNPNNWLILRELFGIPTLQ